MRKNLIILFIIMGLFLFIDNVSAINMDYACGTVVGEKSIVTIKFNTNGGERLNNLMYCYDCGVDKFKLPTPKKNGYKFIGWYTDKELNNEVNLSFDKTNDGKKLSYIIDDTGCNAKRMHVNLYAKWEKNKSCSTAVLSKVTINFETGIDKKLEPLEICASCNDVKIDLPKPESEDKVFIGWYLEKELLTKIPDETTYASNIYLDMKLESADSEECSNNMHGSLYARWIEKNDLKYYIIDLADNNFAMINKRISK